VFCTKAHVPDAGHGAPSRGFAGKVDALFAEIGVVFVDPVLAGWGEDVEVDGVDEGGGGVGKVAGDDEDLAGVNGVRGAVVEVEAESAFGDEGDLLVGVGVGLKGVWAGGGGGGGGRRSLWRGRRGQTLIFRL
jgi:hypothetical protein